MGQGSSYFTKDEQTDILAEQKFTARYLQEIEKRYHTLDNKNATKTKNGTDGVSIKDIMQIPEVHGNKLASMLADKYGGRDAIMYPQEFVNFFGVLSVSTLPSDKMKALFQLLDVKNFGYLGPIEMYRYYNAMLSPSLNNEQIEAVTKNAIRIAGGKIDLNKFIELMPAWEVCEKMTVELQFTN